MAAKKTKNRRRSGATRKTAQKPKRTTAAAKRLLVGFVGAGNMARSLAGGLIANGWPRQRIILSDPASDQRAAIAKHLGVKTYASNADIAKAQIVVLAVKPQMLRTVAAEIATAVQRTRPLIISIAAGIRSSDIQRWLGADLPIVRVMPNTPALVGSGASALYANALVNDAMRTQAESILRSVGITVWLEDETLLDVVTALSGSGPAYFFLVMEALEHAATAAGLDTATARLLTLETAYGAAKMALEGADEPAILRARVTSPGGTTERALKILEQGGLERLFHEAIRGATDRARELGDVLGKGA